MTSKELLQKLQESDPAYWTWLQSHPTALTNVKNMASTFSHFPDYYQAVRRLKSYATFMTGGVTDPVEEELPTPEFDQDNTDIIEPTPPIAGATWNGDGTWTLRNGSIVDQGGNLVTGQSIFQYLNTFLTDNELPSSLLNFIKQSLVQDKPAEQIIAELRQTPEYKAAYPENDMRQQNGLSWMPESWIRDYRNEAKRLAREYMGIEATNGEIAELIGRGTSLTTWEHRLQINDAVRRWGGAVQQVFESATGAPLSQERLHAFFDPNIDTADLDEVYDMALRRGQPATLGFAIRPEEEAKLLRSLGISTEQVFKNYQQIHSEMPRFDRLAAIGGYLDQHGGDFFGDMSVSGSLLFQAVQLGDPKAMAELQRRVSEEAVRFQAGGGPAVSRGGQLTGLSLPSSS